MGYVPPIYAPLIAAAPELLEACRAVMRPDGHYRECPCSNTTWEGAHVDGHIFMPNNPIVNICERLRAAIAKAEGRE